MTCSKYLDTKLFVVQPEVISINFGTFSLSVLLNLFLSLLESFKLGEGLTGICVLNSVEMYLFHDYQDLVSMQHKLISDVIDGMQINLSWGNPLIWETLIKV